MSLFLSLILTTSLVVVTNGLHIPTNIWLNPTQCHTEHSASSFLILKINSFSKEDQSIKRLSHYAGPIPAALTQIWLNSKMATKMLNLSGLHYIERLTDNLKWILQKKSSSLLIKFSTKHTETQVNSLVNMKLITFFYVNSTQQMCNMNLLRIKSLK